MDNNRLIILFLLFFTVQAWFCSAQESEPKKLPIEEFIRIAAKNDTGFQTILIDQLSLKYRRALRVSARDLVLSIQSQYSVFLDSPDEGTENTVSLSKLFPYAGTELTAEYSTSLRATTHQVSSEYSLLISQPLAENAFGRATRLLDDIVGFEIDIANHQIIEAYEDYLATLTQRYYDWYSAYENVKTGENSYNENLRLLENIQERQKNSIALPIDVNKIKLQVLAKEENLVSLRNSYTRYLNLIKEALRYEGDQELIPQVPALYEDTKLNFASDYRYFKDFSRTCQVLQLLEEKSSVEVSKAADVLLPSIDLFVGFSVDGAGHDVTPDEKKGYAGLTIELPLPGEVENAEYETAKIAESKTALSNQNIYARLYTDLRNLHDQIEREEKLIAIADDKIKLAEAIVKDEKENYSYGRSSLNDLIDEVNKLEDNKFNKIFHTVQLKKLIVEWLRLTDRLIVREEVPPPVYPEVP